MGVRAGLEPLGRFTAVGMGLNELAGVLNQTVTAGNTSLVLVSGEAVKSKALVGAEKKFTIAGRGVPLGITYCGGGCPGRHAHTSRMFAATKCSTVHIHTP